MVLDVYYLNEAKDRDEYMLQRVGDQIDRNKSEKDRDSRRYSHTDDGSKVKNNYWSANNNRNRRKFEMAKRKDREEYYNKMIRKGASSGRLHGEGTETKNKYASKAKTDYDRGAMSDAVDRHNRRHPDRKLESAGTGIFGVKY
jgi:hypothetical protein